MALVDLFATHPEVGIKVVGLIGSAREARAAGRAGLWLANYADAEDVLARADVDGVVLCSSDVNPALLDLLIRGEQTREPRPLPRPGPVGHRLPPRRRPCPIAHQPLLYVEPPSLSPAAAAAEAGVRRDGRDRARWSCWHRCCALVALLIKLDDRGPVLFRQQRVGRDGVEFSMLKFRSMCVDAEAQLAALRAAGNDRSGPLFKLDGRRPAGHPHRPVHPGDQPRRAAAAPQRRARRHEPRRAAAGAGLRGRRVPGRAQRPSRRASRHHRAVAGRGPRQPVVRGLPPPRPVLRRQLVARARPRDPRRAPSSRCSCGRCSSPAAARSRADAAAPPPSPPARARRFGRRGLCRGSALWQTRRRCASTSPRPRTHPVAHRPHLPRAPFDLPTSGGRSLFGPEPAPTATRPPAPPPLPADPENPMQLTGAQALIKSLEQEAVEVIFGLPGGCILPGVRPAAGVDDPPHPRAPRAGRRPHGRGLRPRHRAPRRGDGDVGSGGDEPRHAADGRVHGLDPDGRHHRAGPDLRHRQRRLPGVRHRRHHPLGHQAQRARDDGPGPAAGHPPGVPPRLDRAPGPGPRSTCPRTS